MSNNSEHGSLRVLLLKEMQISVEDIILLFRKQVHSLFCANTFNV
jgi:hypothetical protein